MKKDQYTFEDLHKALENIEVSNPGVERITVEQLEKAVRITRTPAIYNVEEIVAKLKEYVKKHEKHHNLLFCTETELCIIIGVKKLALHQWRKRGLIEYKVYGTRTIEYSLKELLMDFEDIKNKNVPIPLDSLL